MVQHLLFGLGLDLSRPTSSSQIYSVECVGQKFQLREVTRLICSTTSKLNMSLNTSIAKQCSQPQNPVRRTQDRKKQELIQTSIQQSFSKGTPYIRKSPRWIEITRAITVYLCKDMVPFQTVERRGFKAMIRAIDPRYEVPSRKYFTETEMPKLYAELRENVEKELCDLKYFATTTDLWSSRTMEPFLSLTIHYITDDWNLGSRCLQTS